MPSLLEQLKELSVVVADTGDIEAIKKYCPEDATTNPSLIFKAAQLPQYESILVNAIDYANKHAESLTQKLSLAVDYLAVMIGKEILNVIPGKISTEVDARLSYDTEASINKAKQLIQLYQSMGVDKEKVLIKLAATWEGIRAAEILEKEGISCNLTLIFSFAQARACAEANVHLISPFVGRVLDWYKKAENREFSAEDDPGVLSVKNIYHYFKQHQYNTIVMGASFRNIGEILALAGCDRLTISPELLDTLSQSYEPLSPALQPNVSTQERPTPLSHSCFMWEHNLDPMAVEKLAEGIRNFAIDQEKLEALLTKKMTETIG